jgi:hypothetical protein
VSLIRHVQYVCPSGIGIEPFSSKLWHPAQWNWKAKEELTSLISGLKKRKRQKGCTIMIGEKFMIDVLNMSQHWIRRLYMAIIMFEHWLIDYLRFYVSLKDFSHNIAGEGLQNVGLMLGAQGLWAGRDLYFIVSPLLWHRISFFSVSSYDARGDVEDLF